jgi:hypothetical protein
VAVAEARVTQTNGAILEWDSRASRRRCLGLKTAPNWSNLVQTAWAGACQRPSRPTRTIKVWLNAIDLRHRPQSHAHTPCALHCDSSPRNTRHAPAWLRGCVCSVPLFVCSSVRLFLRYAHYRNTLPARRASITHAPLQFVSDDTAIVGALSQPLPSNNPRSVRAHAMLSPRAALSVLVTRLGPSSASQVVAGRTERYCYANQTTANAKNCVPYSENASSQP